jgi:hypothetical protein
VALAAVVVVAGVAVALGLRFAGPAAEADTPHPGLDFAIGIDVDGDGTNDCGTGVPLAVGDGAPDAVPVEVANASCVAEADAELVVRVYLMDGGGIAAVGSAVHLYYSGLRSLGSGDAIWTGCVFEASATGSNFENVGCGIGLPPYAYPVSNLGALAVFHFSCTQSGDLALGRSLGETGLTDESLIEHREGGEDELSITCGDRPEPSPTPAPTSLDFAIGIDVDGDGTNDCGTGVPLAVGDGAPDPVPVEVTNTNCLAEPDAELVVRGYLMDAGGLSADGAAVHLYYSGVTSLGTGDAVWTGCVFEAPASQPDFENVGCGIGLPPYAYPVSNLGTLAVFRFSCSQGGVVTLGHSVGETGLTDSALMEHRESGPDSLSVTCGDHPPATGPNPTWTPTPTRPPPPTPTPCAGCPTQTPSPTPTPRGTPTPCPGCPSPQLAIGIDVDGDGTNDCGSGVPGAVGDGAPDGILAEITDSTCEAVVSASFNVNVYLTDTDGIAYGGQASHVIYEGVTSAGRGVPKWSGCVFSATAYAPFGLNSEHWENVGCAIGLPPATSLTYVGLMSRFTFTCTQDGTVWLGHDVGETSLTDGDLHEFREQGGSDVLEVDCGSPPKRETVAGDSDCDSFVSSVDAALILQHTAGLIGRLRCTLSADVDRDGFVTAMDAALVLQGAAGLTEIGP